jgi:Tudor domain
VDFGNREVVANADIRDMPHTLLAQLPSQAILCSLHGINCQSVAGWSPNDIDAFRGIVDDQLLQVFFTSEKGADGQQMVHLLKGQENVNRIFLRASSRLSATYSSPVVGGKTEERAVSRSGAGDGNGGKRFNFEENMAVSRRDETNNSYGIGSKSGASDMLRSVPVTQQVKFTYQSYEPNTVLKCYIAFITSPSKFYCQLKNTADDLDKLMGLLNADPSFDKFTALTTGQACCARYSEDERWYRAVTEQVQKGSGGIRVRFVDYGNEENVSEDAVKQIKAAYMKLPAQAIECSMDEVIAPAGNETRWSPKASAKFEELFGDEAFEVRILCRNASGSVHYVNIDSVAGQMVSLGLAVRPRSATQQDLANSVAPIMTPSRRNEDKTTSRPKDSVTMKFADALHQHNVLKLDSSAGVTVSYVVSPVEFYCQLTSSSHELDVLMEQIEKDYSQLKETDLNIERPRTGQPCCAR